MPKRFAVSVVTAACVLVGGASAQAEQVLDQGGRPGASQLVEPAACRYFGTGGVDSRYLHLAVAAPTIRGVNVRRGRKDYSKARFAVWVSDVNDNYRLLAKSDWSYWMRVSDRRWSQWQGPATSFTANFRGAYSLEILVEWYRRGRLIGWRDARVTNFNYWDNFRIGPYGPFSFCSVAVTQYTAPP